MVLPPPGLVPAEPVVRRTLRARTGLPARVLGLYLLSRAVTTALCLVVVAVAQPGSRIGRGASVIDLLTAWDGQWYRLVEVAGYPRTLPTSEGEVLQNTWAFLPGYPWLVHLVDPGGRAGWGVAAVLVSAVCGAVAALLLALLVRPHVGDRGALVTAALFAFSPVAFVLQAAYAESLSLALLFGALLAIDRGRPAAALPLVAVLGITRPGVQAIALVAAVRLALLVVGARRSRTRPPLREPVLLVLVAALAVLAGFVWPVVAARVTGRPDAYLASELAWHAYWFGPRPFVPVQAWFWSARFWFGALGPVVLGLLAAAWIGFLLSGTARRLGPTVLSWAVAWSAFLVVAFFPQSSVFRLLMPLAPVAGALGGVRRPLLAVLLPASVAAQGVWLLLVYGRPQAFWGVP